MFIRHWMDCDIQVTHGRLRDWVIFKRRVGDFPNKDTGEVMYNFNHYSRALLLDGVQTMSTTHDDEVEFMFVVAGVGSIKVGDEEREMRDGTSFRIPAGCSHVITNTGSEKLELLTARRPPRQGDEKFELHNWREPGHSGQGHWYHVYKGPHVGFHSGTIPPRKISEPHGHHPNFDELWYVYKGKGWHWMGRELHPQRPGWALWLIPEETHSLINPSDKPVEYIYISG